MIVFFAVLGAIMGSFVGVVAERVHTGQSWVSSRSRCNSCTRVLGVGDLLPVVSWLAARGRCFSCSARIPWTYVVTEATLGALFALSYARLGLGLELGFFLVALVVIAFVVLYDLRHTIVPQVASLLLVISSLLFAFLVAPTLQAFGGTLLTAGGIALAFVLLHLLSAGRAMGLGDAPVAFALSLLAAPNAVSGLIFSFWVGALYGIAILVLQRGRTTMKSEVPFVPFLAFGFLLAFFTGWNVFPLIF